MTKTAIHVTESGNAWYATWRDFDGTKEGQLKFVIGTSRLRAFSIALFIILNRQHAN